MKNYIVIVTISILSIFSAFSNEYISNRLTSLDGLSQNDVQGILVDKKGFLWVATNGGLNRYDGYEFKLYGLGYNGLESNLILSLSEDDKGNIWVGTADKGIFVYNYDSDKFISISRKLNPSQAKNVNNIRSIACDLSGNVMCYNSSDLVISIFKYNLKKGDISNFKSYKVDNKKKKIGIVNQIIINNDNYYFCSTKGIFYYDKNKDCFTRYNFTKNNIISVAFLSNKKVLVALYNEVGIYNIFTGKYKSLLEMKKIHIGFDKGVIWMLNGDGLYKTSYDYINNKLKKIEYVSPIKDFIFRTMFVDSYSNLWFGFLKSGIYKVENRKRLFESYSGFGNNHITSCFEDTVTNRVYIGTEGSGVFVLKHTGKSFKIINNLFKDKSSYSISKSSYDKRIYYGFGNSDVYSSKEDGTDIRSFGKFGIGARIIFPVDSFLFIGTYNQGLFRYDLSGNYPIRNVRENDGLCSDIVRNIIKDKFGNILIATNKGISIIKKDNVDNFDMDVHLFPVKEVKGSYIIPMLEDTKGRLWVGGLEKALFCLSTTKSDYTQYTIQKYTSDTGLNNNIIKMILEDANGKIWVSTNRGLNEINPESGLVRSYGVNDGLQDYEFDELSGIQLKTKEILMGGVRGFNVFFPSKIPRDTTSARTVLTDFKLFNRSVLADSSFKGLKGVSIINAKKIILSHNQNSFSFSFSALHYSNPQKNKYKYQLIGFDKDPVFCSSKQRYATYTNIPSGKYTFKISSSNADGVWSKKNLSVDIIIKEPYWETNIAYVIYMLFFILLIITLRKYNINRITRKNAVLVANIEKTKSQEMLEMKTKFFTNISHEFRTPLTLILSPLQEMLNDKVMMNDFKWAIRIKSMFHNGNLLLKLINELLNFSKNEQEKLGIDLHYDDFLIFSKNVLAQFDFWSNDRNIKLLFVSNHNSIKFYYDSSSMEQVLYNLLSNAIKHTPEKGQIKLSITDESDNVKIEVIDNGEGISDEVKDHIFERFYSDNSKSINKNPGTGIGLYLTKSIIEMHGGKIFFKSELGKGTVFTVLLPKVLKLSKKEKEVYLKEKVNPNINVVPKEIESKNTIKSKILVVDDNKEMRVLLFDLFQDDYKVIVVDNTLSAYDMICDSLPDLVISDVMMPEMNGYELCEKIKKNDSISHIPIIFLSAKAGLKDITKGFKYNVDGFCPKPFDNDMLREMVKSVIINRKSFADKIKKKIISKSYESSTHLKESTSEDILLKKLVNYIEANISNSNLLVEDICTEVGISQPLLNKKLKSLLNTTINAFVRSVRLNKAANLLNTGKYSVSDVTLAVGFNDLKYFRDSFKKEFGILPQKFKNKK